MSVTEKAAVESARRFASSRCQPPWNEATVEVRADTLDGRPVWSVQAEESPSSGEAAWMQPHWQPIRYFVDMESGTLLGFATERSRTIFAEVAPPSDEN